MVPKEKIILVLSVDTEEEFDWNSGFPQDNCSIENINQIPGFQYFCENLGIRPTYLVDYPVISDQYAADMFRDFVESGNAEVGAHLHPWCNPPFFSETDEERSHVVNLPEREVEAKLDALIEKIEQGVGRRPKSFRTGRWGINASLINLLEDKGFAVESSVYPLYHNQFFSCEDAPNHPYFPSRSDALEPSESRGIIELPVTVGFNRTDHDKSKQLHQFIENSLLSRLRIIGLLWRLGLLRKIYLSPELSSPEDMLTVARTTISRGNPFLHMYFHSSSLLQGDNPLLFKTANGCNVLEGVHRVISKLKESYEIEFCTLSEAADRIRMTQMSLLAA